MLKPKFYYDVFNFIETLEEELGLDDGWSGLCHGLVWDLFANRDDGGNGHLSTFSREKCMDMFENDRAEEYFDNGEVHWDYFVKYYANHTHPVTTEWKEADIDPITLAAYMNEFIEFGDTHFGENEWWEVQLYFWW